MHTSHLLDFNTINTNVNLSRTLILKEAIHFSSCEYNINNRRQGPVPQNVGELALDIPFLISLKIKLSFIPVHVHACTPLLMAQPKVNLLNKNEGSNAPNSFFELPSLLSFIPPGKKASSASLQALCSPSPKLSTFQPSIHPKAGGVTGCWLLPITLQQRAASLPAVPPPVTHLCAEGRAQWWSPPRKVSLAISECWKVLLAPHYQSGLTIGNNWPAI